jgi:peptidoglycan/xylan/chitin deacetylase (PgdA/CDA1 family)
MAVRGRLIGMLVAGACATLLAMGVAVRPGRDADRDAVRPAEPRRVVEAGGAAGGRPGAAAPVLAGADLQRALWRPEQLEARPGDAAIVRLQPADRAPPDLGRLGADAIEADAPLPGRLAGSIRRVAPDGGRKLVALTFDLCERADDRTGYDGAIVDYLRREGVAATFYAGGKWMRSHPERTQQLMADPLFAIGNHGWTHGNLRVLPEAEARDQIRWTQAQYAILYQRLMDRGRAAGVDPGVLAAVPRRPATFRFPYGSCDAASLRLPGELGLPAIQWDTVSADAAKGQTPASVARTVLAAVRPGSIVVMHANGRGHGTGGALSLIVDRLRGDGYSFVTVPQLLELGTPIAVDSCYELRPGDNLRYDALFGKGTG